jgi:hypothetical protein
MNLNRYGLHNLTILTAKTKTIHLYDDENEAAIERKARRALNAGHTVRRGDTDQWLTISPDVDGEGRFIWHTDANRCRHTWTLYTKKGDEPVVTEKIKQDWKVYA